MIVLVLVSVPYKITLLSNGFFGVPGCGKVSVPYKITLLSNALAVTKGNI